MVKTKAHILEEINRTATLNGGEPLGEQRFTNETGIKSSDWKGRFWVRWSDALREAGLVPNEFGKAYGEEYLLDKYADLARSLGHLPVYAEIRIAGRNGSDFPSYDAFNRLGTKAQLVEKLAEYCRNRPEYAAVVALCRGYAPRKRTAADEASNILEQADGYVYLIKHGGRREYKIGRTNNALRREGEIALELPERVQPIHVIRTDDPAGIEAYWHKRFEAKRKNGEWFELNVSDVAAFKRRKFM